MLLKRCSNIASSAVEQAPLSTPDELQSVCLMWLQRMAGLQDGLKLDMALMHSQAC